MLRTNFDRKFCFWKGGTRDDTGNGWLDLGCDPDPDADTGIFKRNFTVVGWGIAYEFCISIVALAEVCGLKCAFSCCFGSIHWLNRVG